MRSHFAQKQPVRTPTQYTTVMTIKGPFQGKASALARVASCSSAGDQPQVAGTILIGVGGWERRRQVFLAAQRLQCRAAPEEHHWWHLEPKWRTLSLPSWRCHHGLAFVTQVILTSRTTLRPESPPYHPLISLLKMGENRTPFPNPQGRRPTPCRRHALSASASTPACRTCCAK